MYLLLTLVVGFTVSGPLLASVATPVAAQTSQPGNNTTTTAGDGGETQSTVYQLGEDARITNVEWDGRTVEITVRASDYTTVSVTDAGALTSVDEGSVEEIPYQTYTVPSDTERTLEFTVADSGAKVVTVQAGDTLVAIVQEKGNSFLSGTAGWDEVYAGVGAAAFVVGGLAIVTGILTWYAKRRDYRRRI